MLESNETPELIQWHEGMLLLPHHFQQMNLRNEELLRCHIGVVSPFHWGILNLEIDPVLLLEGKLRVTKLDAIMPDCLVIRHPFPESDDLEIDLKPHAEELAKKALTVHIAVPVKKPDSADKDSYLPRYDSVEGESVLDENIGSNAEKIARLRPRLTLLACETPPQKYVSFPLAKVTFSGETFALAKFTAPALSISKESPIGKICVAIAEKVREKAIFLSEKLNASSSIMRGTMINEMQEMIHKLVSPLSYLEGLVYSGKTHPYNLYLAICSVFGNVAGLSGHLIPPVMEPYKHNDLFATFNWLKKNIFQMLDEGIQETYTAVPFVFEKGSFNLLLKKEMINKRLIIGVKGEPGSSSRGLTEWLDGCLIASNSKIQSLTDKRILGAERNMVENEESLFPERNTIIFSIKFDPEFIVPDDVLRIYSSFDKGNATKPLGIILYVKK